MANLAELQAAAKAKKQAMQAEQLKKEGFLVEGEKQEVVDSSEQGAQESVPSASKTIIAPNFLQQMEMIPNLIEATDNEQEHVLLYGAPKCGKTLASALLSEFYHILWFDGDKGLKTAMNI